MQAKRPKKVYGKTSSIETSSGTRWETKYFREFEYIAPAMTNEEMEIVNECQKPCRPDVIIDLSARYLEIHKKHIVDDENKRILLYTDMAELLCDIPEYALTLGIRDIINDSKIIFFPNVGQIREAAEKHIIEYPKEMKGSIPI
jgi:hypothetical protein